jgi:hypothetical protein
MEKAEPDNALMRAVFDYKKGRVDLKTGSAEVARIAQLTPEIAAVFLTAMKRDNIRSIQKPSGAQAGE